jgi:Rad51 protein
LGNQHANQQLLKYYCSKCDMLLKTTRDGFDIDFKFFNSKEECPYCGSLISKTLRKENVHGTATTNNMSLSSSSLCLLPPPKIQTAYEQFSNRLTFGIEKIDSVLQLTTGEIVCIVSTDHNNYNKYANNILLSRLCVRAVMSNRQGGFNSPKVIFVDAAGNASDVYQCVNFARQYGLNIKKTLQSIVVSRSFTIYQLANIIINELPKVLEQLSGTKVIVIGNLLSLFVNDPQVQIKGAKSLIRQIVNAVKTCTNNNNNILCVISFCCSNNIKTYARIILERIDKCIEITTRGVKDGNDKQKRNRKNDDDLSIDIKIKNDKNPSWQQHSIILQEKVLHLVSKR